MNPHHNHHHHHGNKSMGNMTTTPSSGGMTQGHDHGNHNSMVCCSLICDTFYLKNIVVFKNYKIYLMPSYVLI